MYTLYKFHFLNGITEINQLFDDILIIWPAPVYVAYATQATISSVKHKPLFHRNYLEQYVPGTFFPPDLLLSAFPSRSKLPRRLVK